MDKTEKTLPPRTFSLTDFKASSDTMIAINDKAYERNYLQWDRVRPLKDYTIEEVHDIIKSGNLLAQRDLSRNYFNANGMYKQVIMHFGTLLKNIGILIPNPTFGKSLQDKPIAKRYYNAVDFVERMKLQEVLTHVSLRVLIDGRYYGAIQTLDKTTFTLMDLPFNFCRVRFQDEKGNYLLEFNVKYFNTFVEESAKNSALKTYPKVISNYYRRWSKNSALSPWVLLPSDIGVAFDLFDARPYFLSIIPATIQYDQAVENENARELEEIKKMVIQKIPHLNDGTLLFEPNEVEVMHEGAVKMLKTSNPNTSVLTTYGDVDVVQSKSSDSVTHTTLDQMSQNVYANAGVSSEIFASTNSATLKSSLDYDTGVMMILGNKYSTFITNIVNKMYGNSAITFKYVIQPITYHNVKDVIDGGFKLAGSGYSFLLPALAQGFTQRDLSNIKDLENNVLKLHEKLLPLQSSYTQSSSSEPIEDQGGRPPLEDDSKTEKTVQNKESKDKTGNQGG